MTVFRRAGTRCRQALSVWTGILLALGWLGPGARVQAQTGNTVQFSSATYSVLENVGYIAAFLVRQGNSDTDLTVDYHTRDGTARAGVDYRESRGSLYFPAGETTRALYLDIYNNNLLDGNRTIMLSLDRVTGGGFALGSPATAVVTIMDDEASLTPHFAGFVGFSSSVFSVTHDEWRTDPRWPKTTAGAWITVVRTGGSHGRIKVDWAAVTQGYNAIPDEDFVLTNGTVTLNDFQMSTNFMIPILSSSYPYLFDTNVLTNVLYSHFVTNLSLGLVLYNPRAATEDGEDPATVSPLLGLAEAELSIVQNNVGFAFERLHYQVAENHGTLLIWVKRSWPTNESVSVRYAINPWREITDNGGDHLDNMFFQEPGSDYAAPFADFLPPGSDAWKERTGLSENILRWEANDTRDKLIQIPIVDDNEVEFNEDILVQLYKKRDEKDGEINDAAGACLVTILDNEQPAGVGDRDFNAHDNPNTDPPNNHLPGANNTMQTLAVQPDGKILIGGDFTAVNGQPRKNRITRLNFDGSLDATFITGDGANGLVGAIALQPDGRIALGGAFSAYNGHLRKSMARLNADGSLDASFDPGQGANGAVRTVALQPDGKILVGGDFTQIAGESVPYLARLQANGSLDYSFKPGAGPNGPVYAIALVGQPFLVDRQPEADRAKDSYAIDTGSRQGRLEISYNCGANPDNIRVYYEGLVVQEANNLRDQGVVTVAYGPGNSTQITVVVNEGVANATSEWKYRVKVLPRTDDRIAIGGGFTSYGGLARGFIARLNADGSLDRTFDPGTGADAPVYAVAKFGEKTVLAGGFRYIDQQNRSGLARLLEDGSLDTEYDPGNGADKVVYSLAIQPTGKVVLGGLFTAWDGVRRVGLARVNLDGTLDTSFLDTAYNQYAGLVNSFSPENPSSQENFIKAISPYSATNISFFSYTNVVETTVNDTNVTLTNITVFTNVVLTDFLYVGGRFKQLGGGFRRDDLLPRSHIARVLGHSTPGPGNLSFSRPVYAADEDAGQVFIGVTRTNGSLAPAAAMVLTEDLPAGPGAAIAGLDYLSTNQVVSWMSGWDLMVDWDRKLSDSFLGPNTIAYRTNRVIGDFTVYTNEFSHPSARFEERAEDDVYVRLLDDDLVEGQEDLRLRLSPLNNSFYLGGVPIPIGLALGRSTARLTVVDNDFQYGKLGFAALQYYAVESDGAVRITVQRQGGSTGAVAVDYGVTGGTARPNSDYVLNSGTLSFESGQTEASFEVFLINDSVAELDRTIQLELRNPTGFPANMPGNQIFDTNATSATVTIVDDDWAAGRARFAHPDFTGGENQGSVELTVQRLGGSSGALTLNYHSLDGTARAGIDYLPTNGVLRWDDKDISPRRLLVPLLDNDLVNGNRSFAVELSDPSIPGALTIPSKATVNIRDDDAYGMLLLSQSDYVVDENGGEATLSVVRFGGEAGTVSARFSLIGLTAVPGRDFQVTNGVLEFGPHEYVKRIKVAIQDNADVDGNRSLQLVLSQPIKATLGDPARATLTIIDNETYNTPSGSLDHAAFGMLGADQPVESLALQPDGRLLIGGDFQYVNTAACNRLARLHTNGTLDRSFLALPGPNNTVKALCRQADGRILIGGLFTEYSGFGRFHLARLNADGSVDATFDPGGGADNPVYGFALQSDDQILVVGSFTRYNGVPMNSVARLQTNGLLDVQFSIGTGADGPIFAVALQRDQKILLAGDFNRFNGWPAPRITRLLPDGQVDRSFAPGLGADEQIRAMEVQPDGLILVGGLFAKFNDQSCGRVVRLLPNGSLDPDFTTGEGANDSVYAIAMQPDGKILIGGDFTRFGGVTRRHFARLRANGEVDPTLNIGAGANGYVGAITVQPDRQIIIGGGFTAYDNQAQPHLARVFGGSLSGNGSIEFAAASYRGGESRPATITVRRTGGTTGEASIHYSANGGTAIPGIDYEPVEGVLRFQNGENEREFVVNPIDDSLPEPDETINLMLANVEGAALGPQPNSVLTLESDDSVLDFHTSTFTVNENEPGGRVLITVTRNFATNDSVAVDYATVDGTAIAGRDYEATHGHLVFAPGEKARTFFVPIVNNSLKLGNHWFSVALTNASPSATCVLGGAVAKVFIIEDDLAPGVLAFAQTACSVIEGRRDAVITIVRTNGGTGVVSVNYQTHDGTAVAGRDYLAANGILAFSDGELMKSIVVSILDDDLVEGNEILNLTLSNPTGGALLGAVTNLSITVVDNDVGPGSLDPTFDPAAGANGTVRSLALLPDGRFLVVGDFTTMCGQPRFRCALLAASGNLDTNFLAPVVDGPVHCVTLRSFTEYLLGGGFAMVGNEAQSAITDIHLNGEKSAIFTNRSLINGEVRALLCQPDGKVVASGQFTQPVRGILRLTSDGIVDPSFNPEGGTEGSVLALALQADGHILVGGDFHHIGQVARPFLARLDTYGRVDWKYAADLQINGPVYCLLLLPDDRLLMGGDFTEINGIKCARLARLLPNGMPDPSFSADAGANAAVLSLARHPNGNLYIGGKFTQIQGASWNRIARLTPDGKPDPAFNPGMGANDAVLAIAIQADGNLLLGGAFTQINGAAWNHVARLLGDRELRFQTAGWSAQSGFTANLDVMPTRRFVIDTSTNLHDWTPVCTNEATGLSWCLRQDHTNAPVRQFFRARRLP